MVCEKTLPIDNGTRSNKINFAVGVVLDDTLDAKASAPSESEIQILRFNQYYNIIHWIFTTIIENTIIKKSK